MTSGAQQNFNSKLQHMSTEYSIPNLPVLRPTNLRVSWNKGSNNVEYGQIPNNKHQVAIEV
ncbi:unnamed protein product, partial [Sphenostylis stenocarpa]